VQGEGGTGEGATREDASDGRTCWMGSWSTLTGTDPGGRDRVVPTNAMVNARTGCLGRRRIHLAGCRVNVMASSERRNNMSRVAE
jgi:hypothetical protein